MSVVSAQIVRQLKYYASEFRELRRYNELEDAEYSLLGKLGSTLADAFDTNAMPSPILDVIAANHPELQDSDRRANCLVKLVIGFQGESAGPDRMNVVFVGPGCIVDVWPELFGYAWCYDTNDHEISQTITTALVKHRFEIFGYYATACDLLAEWIENHADDDRGDRAGDQSVDPFPNDGLDKEGKAFTWGGRRFDQITSGMMRVLGLLESERSKGHPNVSKELIRRVAKVGITGGMKSQVFKLNRKDWPPVHPVSEIVIDNGDGTHRLIAPEKVPVKIPDCSGDCS